MLYQNPAKVSLKRPNRRTLRKTSQRYELLKVMTTIIITYIRVFTYPLSPLTTHVCEQRNGIFSSPQKLLKELCFWTSL